jgi:predicted TIM-barrel fold metal-dependent hydrolase
MAQVAEPGTTGASDAHVKLGVIDTDCHVAQNGFFADPALAKRYMSQRWLDYMALMGLKTGVAGGFRPRQREFAHRTDTVPPGGGSPGGNLELAVAQVLDAYDMSGSIMNDLPYMTGAKNMPDGFAVAISRASNEYRRDEWLAKDDRWYAAICVTQEVAEEAVKEIARCKEEDGFKDRWVSVMLAPDALHPAGNHRYWPIYEACEHYGIPISYHVLASRRTGAVGHTTYYMEEHTDFALFNFHTVSSLVFEGVFQRFPKLNVSMIELAWSWAIAYAWRLDAAWGKLKDEVAPHFTGDKKPSEIFAEHFWFSTQPMEEPDNAEWIDDVYASFCQAGFANKLMYSSDYPHWDFDAPDALWDTLTVDDRRRILGENAAELYKIPLKENSGLELDAAGMPVPLTR